VIDKDSYAWYILEVNPEPWAIGPVGYARRNGKMSAYVGRNAQLDAYKESVKEAIEELDPLMLEGKIALRFFFWRHQAAYETVQARTHRKHEADVTNLQKATEDALQGILYKNDKDVVDIHSTMVDQSSTAPGRVVVGIASARDVIFSDYPFDKLKMTRRSSKKIVAELEGQEGLDFDFEDALESDNSWPPR
jgi:Holliday junction resolvase RusA-like endonuclease